MNISDALANTAIAIAVARNEELGVQTRSAAYIRAATYLATLQAQLTMSQEAGEILEQWPRDSFYEEMDAA